MRIGLDNAGKEPLLSKDPLLLLLLCGLFFAASKWYQVRSF